MQHAAQVPFLQLLGPAWTRTFRCLWMLEELLEASSMGKDGDTTGSTGHTMRYHSGITINKSTALFRYELIDTAKPTSRLARTYNSTGKVPILLVHYNIINRNRNRHATYTSSGTDNGRDRDSTNCDTTNSDDPQYRTANPDLILSESSAINTFLADHFGGVATGLIPPPASFTSVSSAVPLSPQQSLHHQSHLNDRAIYDMLVSCITTELDAQALWIHRKHEVMAEHFGRIPKAVSHAKKHFSRINAHLCTSYLQQPPHHGHLPSNDMPGDQNSRLYLLGNQFSAVDILYVHCLDWSRAIGWESTWASIQPLDNAHTTPYVALQSYLQRCHARPAYQRAVQLRDQKRRDRTPLETTATTGSGSGYNYNNTESKL